MKNKFQDIQVWPFFLVLAFALIQGCSSTPIVRESYSKEEVNRGGAGLGLLIRFNPVGQRHESCSIGDNCWIFGSPYDVYFEVSSPEMQLDELCFEDVEFRDENEILYSSEIGYCGEFRFDKLEKDYRVYERIPMVDLGFHEGREILVTLKTKFKGQLFEHRITVLAIKSGESSNDFLRHIYSI